MNISSAKVRDYTFAALLAGALIIPSAANAAGNTGGGASGSAGAPSASSSGTGSPTAPGATPPANSGAGASGSNVTEQNFSALDSDRSGTISATEFRNGNLSGDYNTLDANRDGNLTLSELRQGSAAGTSSRTNR